MQLSLCSLFRIALPAIATLVSLLPIVHADFDDEAKNVINSVFEKSRTEIPYCTKGQNCSIKAGTDIVASAVSDVAKDETASQFFQRIATNIVTVLGIVGVLFIVYAGFLYLTAGGDDDKTKTAKTIITSVLIGFVIIFLAWSAVTFVTQKILAPSTKETTQPNFGTFEYLVPRAYADSIPSQVTFKTYQDQILVLVPKIQNEMAASGISTASAQKLRDLIVKAALTLPDSGVNLSNAALVTDVLGKVDQVIKTPNYEAVESQLMKSLEIFLTDVKVPKISALVTASPDRGNSPLISTISVRDVKDPSGAPILSENIIWGIKTAGGVFQIIGRGTSLSRRFVDQGTNTVFVAILSSSKNKAGYTDVLSYTNRIEVNVQERLANVYVYVNGISLSDIDEVKLNPLDARSVIIDATATSVPAGVTITRTSWSFGNGVTKVYDGAPKIERQSYAADNTYPVWLRITTNRGDIVDKKFNIVIRDPIASIDADKTEGMVGDEFKFKTRARYSNNGYTYVWEIRDPDSGNVIYTTNGLSATYIFRKSGKFSVRLRTISPDNKEDVDSKTVSIDSREPIAKFSSKIASQETPDTWYLDASSSFDPDTAGGQLTYEWTIDGDPVRLANPVRGGAAGIYVFDSVGEHRVGISVTNRDGKIAQQESTITVKSLLSVSLDVAPQIIRRGESTLLRATSRHAEVFEWDFGDGTKDTGSRGEISHRYEKSGTYSVALTVRNNTDSTGPTSNTIRRSVYVVDSDQPYALITPTVGTDPLIAEENACNGENAFPVNRVTPTKFSAAQSINVDGKTSGLSYFWKIGNEKTSTQRDLTYKFDDLGCVPVLLTVKSDVSGKTSTRQTWAKVVNTPPELSNLSIQTPDLNSDPIVIKVTAQNAKDPDGAIVSYTWFYSTDNDSEPQGFRVTTLPTVTYVLPKIAGKYYFGVVMEDTNGDQTNTEANSEHRHATPLLSSDSNLMTPIVKLTASTDSPLVGDEVKFTVVVRNAISDDISTKGNLEFKWDFDGDGFYDRQTTEPTAAYAFGLPGQFAPKVKVTYKGVSTTQSVRVTVSNVLRPRLVPVVIGDKLVVFNTTSGFFKTASWTADNTQLSGNPGYALASFSGALPTQIGLTVSDGSQEKSEHVTLASNRRNALLIRTSSDPLVVISNKLVDANGTILMSSTGITIDDASDKLWVYLGASKVSADRYIIDTDASLDSTYNGDPADDADNSGDGSFTSGIPFQINLTAYKKRHVALRFALLGTDGKVISARNYELTLAYLPEEAPKEVSFDSVSDIDKVKMEKIKGLIQQAPEQDRLYLMKSLAQLKDLWEDKVGKTETIIAMQGYVDASQMPDAVKKDLFSVLDSLITGDNQTTDDVTLAANVVKNLIPNDSPEYAQVVAGDKIKGEPGLLDQILSHPNDATLNRELGKKILDLIKDDDKISVENKLTIKEQLRVIIAGGTAQLTAPEPVSVTTEEPSSGGILHTLAVVGKWLVIILGSILGIVVIAGFILKSTNRNANTGFADGLIDLFGKNGRGPAPTPKPNTPTPSVVAKPAPATPVVAPKPVSAVAQPVPASQPAPAPKKEEVPDWLKAATGTAPVPKASPEVVPDWLKVPTVAPAKTEAPVSTPVPQAKMSVAPVSQPVPASQPAPAPKKEEVPDWLKPHAAITAPTAPVTPVAPVAPPSVAPAASSSDLPDWLKTPTVATPAPVSEKKIETPVAPKEEKSATPTPKPVSAPKPEIATPAKPSSAEVDDLPDWLKAPVEPVATAPLDTPEKDDEEDETSENAVIPSVYERTPDGKIVKKPVAKKKTSAKKEAKPETEDKPKKASSKKAT